MSTMLQIKSFIQNVAEAISAVIDIEVTIVDDRLVRIVGTGKSESNVGQKLTSGSLAWKVFNTKKSIVVENSVDSPLCKDCPYVDSCKEHAEILYPIIMDDEVIGVIGLIAFSTTQKERLFNNKEYLSPFVEKMALLICSKISELEKTTQISSLNNELEKIIDNVDEGIIATNEKFIISYTNHQLNQYFNLRSSTNKHISHILSCEDFLKNLKDYPLFEDYLYIHNDEQFLINSYKFENTSSKSRVSFLFVIRKVSDIQKKEYSARAKISQRGHVAKWHFDHIVANSDKMSKLVEEAKHYSKTNSTIIIQGESGTGKEIMAQCIHNHSNRKKRPFVAINCAAIPGELLESILFGYAPGAFTGANKNGKLGLFELAHTGTIFLDEIGEMSLSLQSHLLRVLEEKEILRVGGDKVIPVDVRIIAATNRDLYAEVLENRFREDLFYRLNVLNIFLPPLRERKKEILAFTNEFANFFADEYSLPKFQLSEDMICILIEHNWPGNIRELRNIIERIAIKSGYTNLTPDIIRDLINGRPNLNQNRTNNFNIKLTGDFKDIERQIINQVMNTSDNLDQVSEKLGISKTTIWRRLQTK